MKYSTKIKRRTTSSSRKKALYRRVGKYSGRRAWSRTRRRRDKSDLKRRLKKAAGIAAAVCFIFLFIGTIGVLSVLAKYTSELPEPGEAFTSDQIVSSAVYDRNGKKLYDIFADENREIAKFEEIPDHVKWAFLAAEDIDFYEHQGIDLPGIIRCAWRNYVQKDRGICGASTIGQTMLKNTVLTNERSYERKVKEIILTLQVERKYEKDEILQMFLNEIPFGGNVYGIKTASRIYFDKQPQDLTLAEAALLAGIIDAPGRNSPIFGADLEQSKQNAKIRQNYVLDQMLNYKDRTGVTEEQVEEAKDEELIYKSGHIDLKAPHFVFYVQDILQEEDYFLEERPFTLREIEQGGLKIYTTLDMDLQDIAQETIRNEVEMRRAAYNANNGALVHIDSNTGEILAMVGSKDYFGEPTPDGRFDPKVNVAIALRQPGSSMKPITYYAGFETGQLNPATFLPDIPLTFSGGYEPKNADNAFRGINMHTRRALIDSRNIPAVQAVEVIGVDKFIDTAEKFGYSTFKDRSMFGPAITLGAGDVKLLEHTGAFSVFSTGGIYHKPQPILKVLDKDDNVLFEYNPGTGKRVADERAVYLINHILGDKTAGSWRDWRFIGNYALAGKTGTSDENKNVYYMGYSPDFSIGVWLGNNNNDPLSGQEGGAWGATVALPVWHAYVSKIIGRYPETQFHRPAGIVERAVCSDTGFLPGNSGCPTMTEVFIEDKLPEEEGARETFYVCDDQSDRLAREIDKQTGHAVQRTISRLRMAKPEWQPQLDRHLGTHSLVAKPTEYCDVNRNPSGKSEPWIELTKPASGANVSGDKLEVEFTAYSPNGDITRVEMYIDGDKVATASNLPYSGQLDVSGLSTGSHTFTVRVYDASNRKAQESRTFTIKGSSAGEIRITSPEDSDVISSFPAELRAVYSGSGTVSRVEFYVTNLTTNTNTQVGVDTSPSGGVYTVSWGSTSAAQYEVYCFAVLSDGSKVKSGSVLVTVP